MSTATSLAFFAMVGFEDSVNMAEETKDPSRIFPKVMLTGLGITAVIYVLVSICAVAVVPIGELAGNETPLVTVVQTAAPDFPIADLLPFISMFAVANTALINMMMASRLLYGMSKQGVLPGFLSRVSPAPSTPSTSIVFTTLISLALIGWVSLDPTPPSSWCSAGRRRSCCCRCSRSSTSPCSCYAATGVDHEHFRPGVVVPVIGVITCLWLVLPFSSGRDPQQYQIAGALLGLGILLWVVTWFTHGRKQPEKAPTGLVTEPTVVVHRTAGTRGSLMDATDLIFASRSG